MAPNTLSTAAENKTKLPKQKNFGDLPRELLIEKEKDLDKEIAQEIEKVKMSEDFSNTMKSDILQIQDHNMDPLSLTANLNNLLSMSDNGGLQGVDDEF